MKYLEVVMTKLFAAVLLLCVSLVFVSCGSRELREEYYDPTSYGDGALYHPWNSPFSRNIEP